LSLVPTMVISGGVCVFRKTGAVAVIVMLMLTVSGCSTLTISEQEEYPLSQSIEVIDLMGYNGEMRWASVRANEQPRIEILKEVYGSDIEAMEEYMDEILIEDYSSDIEVILQAVQPKHRSGVQSASVRFTVYAPPERITHFFGQTNNGAIQIDASFNGYLGLTTGNGSIILASGVGEVDAITSNGRIRLGGVRLTGSSSFRTSNGRIEGSVALPSTGRFLFETSNGRIHLKMPASTSGTFNMQARNGKINFYLGSETISQEGYANVVLGSEPFVDIRTTNGEIDVVADGASDTLSEGWVFR